MSPVDCTMLKRNTRRLNVVVVYIPINGMWDRLERVFLGRCGPLLSRLPSMDRKLQEGLERIFDCMYIMTG